MKFIYLIITARSSRLPERCSTHHYINIAGSRRLGKKSIINLSARQAITTKETKFMGMENISFEL
jgi:putative heme iron utilization protein